MYYYLFALGTYRTLCLNLFIDLRKNYGFSSTIKIVFLTQAGFPYVNYYAVYYAQKHVWFQSSEFIQKMKFNINTSRFLIPMLSYVMLIKLWSLFFK